MNCPKCGCALPDDSEFCQYCGSKVFVEDENIAAPEIPVAELPKSADAQQSSQEASKASDEENIFPAQQESESACSPPAPENHYTEPTPDADGLTDAPNETPADDKKKKFCKFCGGLVNAETKKCSLCGQQFFRFSKRIVGVIALAVVFIALAGLSVYQYVSNNAIISDMEQLLEANSATISDFEQQIKTKDSTISTQELTIATQKIKISDLQADAVDLQTENRLNFWELDFYESYAAIVADDGTAMYHVYGCEDLSDASFWIYNINAAEDIGYYPCPRCH